MTHKINIDRLKRLVKGLAYVCAERADVLTTAINLSELRSALYEISRLEILNKHLKRNLEVAHHALGVSFQPEPVKYDRPFVELPMCRCTIGFESILRYEVERELKSRKFICEIPDDPFTMKYSVLLKPTGVDKKTGDFIFAEDMPDDSPSVDDILERVKEDFDPALGAKVCAEIAELREQRHDLRLTITDIMVGREDSPLRDKLIDVLKRTRS